MSQRQRFPGESTIKGSLASFATALALNALLACGGKGHGSSLDSGDAAEARDASVEIAQTRDAPLTDADVADATDGPGKDGRTIADSGSADAFGNGVILCAGQSPVVGFGYCRNRTDCGPIGPVVCSLGHYDWGPAACPLPPGSQPCPNDCATDEDCAAQPGGKCVPFDRVCPKCNGHRCTYAPPPCTSSPNSCGAEQRCRVDGACEPVPCSAGGSCGLSYRCAPTSATANYLGCEPIPCDGGYACPAGTRCHVSAAQADSFGCELTPCDQGYACPAETRCAVGSPRADSHGCEYTRCNEGFACQENSRCTVAEPPAYDHGCTAMPCKSDADCDCGYCVGGICSAAPATCQYPPV